MGKIAFLYPGQGAQKVHMGQDFYEQSSVAKELFEMAEQVLDFDVKQVCFEENSLLDQTAYTQAAMVTTCLAMTSEFLKHGIKPDVTAGLSLGEYAAIAVAGGMSYEDAIHLVRVRGILMEEAVPDGKGAMAAVLGMDARKIEELIKGRADVSVANYNCPGQIVITGMKDAVEEAMEDLVTAGAKRCIRLNVSGPFHSEFMKEAAEKLRAHMQRIPFQELKLPYVTNVTAEYIQEAEKIEDLLVCQMVSPVRWMQSIEKMIAEGVDTFVEIGPGKTLSGFVKKINSEVHVYHVETIEQIGEVICQIEK